MTELRLSDHCLKCGLDKSALLADYCKAEDCPQHALILNRTPRTVEDAVKFFLEQRPSLGAEEKLEAVLSFVAGWNAAIRAQENLVGIR